MQVCVCQEGQLLPFVKKRDGCGDFCCRLPLSSAAQILGG